MALRKSIVGQAQCSRIEDLQQRTQHRRVRLLHLVEQDDARAGHVALHQFPIEEGELFLRPRIARGCPGQGGGVVLLGQGVHVDPAQCVGVAGDLRGQAAGQFGLADTGRPDEQQRRDRTAWVTDPGGRDGQGADHRIDGCVLADDRRAQRR